MTAGNLRIISSHFIHWHSTDTAAQVKECLSFLPGAIATVLRIYSNTPRRGSGHSLRGRVKVCRSPSKLTTLPPGLALEGTTGQRHTVLWKSAKSLTFPFQKPNGDSLQFTQEASDSVYFHHLCRDSCAVSPQPLTKPLSNFQAGPAFISHCPLAFPHFFIMWID